jgi:hypothetical protein
MKNVGNCSFTSTYVKKIIMPELRNNAKNTLIIVDIASLLLYAYFSNNDILRNIRMMMRFDN